MYLDKNFCSNMDSISPRGENLTNDDIFYLVIKLIIKKTIKLTYKAECKIWIALSEYNFKNNYTGVIHSENKDPIKAILECYFHKVMLNPFQNETH